MNCSDAHLAHVCGGCGSLISVQFVTSAAHSTLNGKLTAALLVFVVESNTKLLLGGRPTRSLSCTNCNNASKIKPINLPYVYRLVVLWVGDCIRCPPHGECCCCCYCRYLCNELAAMGIKLTMTMTD